MDVVLGAAIALVGSLVGGFIAPIVLARIEDKREIAKEAREHTRNLQASRNAAAQEITDAFVAITRQPANADAQAKILRATLDLELLLGDGDDHITTMVADAATTVHQGTSTEAVSAATVCLAAWARGAWSADRSIAEYERLTGRSLAEV